MQIIEIENQNLWNGFVLRHGGDFLQSWEWKELQKALGRKVFLLGIIDKKSKQVGVDLNADLRGSLVAIALVIKYPLALRKSYLYCPHGLTISQKSSPPADPSKEEKINTQKYLEEFHKLFFTEIKKIAKEEKAVFFRIDFGVQFSILNFQFSNLLKKFNFQKIKNIGSAVNQPLLTWQLDISRSEKEILAGMKPKTRYNIRLSQRKGVKVRIMNYESRRYANDSDESGIMKQKPRDKKEDFEIFYKLLQETAERDKFHLHPREHYEKLLEIFNYNYGTAEPASVAPTSFANDVARIATRPVPSKARDLPRNDSNGIVLFLAEYKKESLAAIMVLFWGNKAIYLHGGTSSEKRNLMASYLIQWEAIKEAKRRGCTIYDFGAITPLTSHQLPETSYQKWQGITRFKQGFKGQAKESAGIYDLVFQPGWYMIYKIAKKLKS